MKRITTLVIVTLSMLFAVSARIGSAQDAKPTLDGNQLLQECNLAIKATDGARLTTTEAYIAGHCVGYLAGVYDALWMTPGHLPGKDCIAAIPDGVSITELVKVVVKYLNDHPNRLHLDYEVLTFIALGEAYPCSNTHK